jgi:hypothetical protein
MITNLAALDTSTSTQAIQKISETEFANVELNNGNGVAYTLPIASASTLGGIKVGTNLAINAGGVLSVTLTEGLSESLAIAYAVSL